MSNKYYYYLDQNVFASLQHSQADYDNFFNELLKVEAFLKLDSENRKFIITPFSVIEYLGIEKKYRLKPSQNMATKFIKKHEPDEAFSRFVEFSCEFFDSKIEIYHSYLLAKNKKKIASGNFKPYMKVLWDGLITEELLKDDFKIRLFESLRWDYITDWIQVMPDNAYKINVATITSELLNYGMNNVHVNSINLFRLVKIFNSLPNFKKFKRDHKELSEQQIALIETRRDSLLRSKETKTAGKDLIDMDINQLSVTGRKINEKNIVPVISFTTDATDKICDRIYALKDILGIYYNETIKPSDRQLIDNFKPGIILRLNKPTKDTLFKVEKIIETKTINERWLQHSKD